MLLRALDFTALMVPMSISVVVEKKEHLLRKSDWLTTSGQPVPDVKDHVGISSAAQPWVRNHKFQEVARAGAGINSQEVSRPGMNLPMSKVTTEFLAVLTPCSHCRSFKRFGGAHDGGYVMCTENMANVSLAAVYSYGISGEDQWGMDVAKTYNIPLFEFDCENQIAPEPYPGVHVVFNKKCVVSSSSDDSHTTLGEQLAENHHDVAKEGSLVMKLDIEGAEWDLFASLPEAIIKRFQQIVVEFHHLGQQARHGLYLKAIQNILKAGFVVAHLHGNNIIHPTQLLAGSLSTNAGMVHFGEDQIPDVLEVTFVKEASSGQPCQGHKGSYFIPQDSRNGEDFPELADPVLPVPVNHEALPKISDPSVSDKGAFSPEKARQAFSKLSLPPLALDKLKLLVNGLKHDVDNVTTIHLT